jgi:hypothetical protein
MADRYVVTYQTPGCPTGYWRGPDHDWGKTFVGFAEARVFSSLAAAENALRRVFGTYAEARRQGMQIQRSPRNA